MFRTQYEQPENKLTYAWLALAQHLEVDTLATVLERIGLPAARSDSFSVRPLYGGGESNPDGAIVINAQSDAPRTIYLENKTFRRPLDLDQARRHLLRVGRSDLLLVLTTDKRDLGTVKSLNDDRVHHATWTDLLAGLHKLAAQVENPKDRFLLTEFVDYVERGGEAWRAKMIEKSVVEDVSQVLRLLPRIREFQKQSWQVVNSFKDDIQQKFDGTIESARVQDHWGRVGAECVLRQKPFGQWLFFGVYYDIEDHNIPFKPEGGPETAIFLDVFPDKRGAVAKIPRISDRVKELQELGYEFNFGEIGLPQATDNPWRLCYWRDSLSKYVDGEVEEFRETFEERLGVLLRSAFFKSFSEGA